MSRLLAIDWDHQNVRVVVAEEGRNKSLRVVAADQTAVPAGEEPIEQRIGLALSEAIRSTKSEKARCLIGIGHGQIDLAYVQVPPATDSELPGLVANLAQRELATATDDAAVDFVVYQSTEPLRPVCVMVLPEEERRHIDTVCQHAGISPTRIVLRAFGLKAFSADPDPTILVSCADAGADLVLLDNGQPLVARSLRFPTNSTLPQISQHFTNELRRTLLSHPQEFPLPDIISHINILNDGPLADALKQPLTEEYEASAAIINPFASVQSDLPTTANADYSGLLGMLLNESSGEPPDVDFLNPKQPPTSVGKTKPLIAAALCLITLIAGGVWYVQSQYAEIDSENARLSTELSELKALVKKSLSKRRLARSLTSWEKSRITWPDELRDITLRMPPRDAMTIQNLTVSSGRNGTSLISFRGVATKPDAVAVMESRLRDKYHNPRTPGLREQQVGDKTVWTFQTSMSVTARSPAEYALQLKKDVASGSSGSDDSKPESTKARASR